MLINITQHCTLRCAHCMQCAGPERNEYMSRETFDKALKFSQDINSKIINITGGEPTSHPLFFEFLEEALKLKDCIITVLSNGTFLSDRDFVKKFSDMVKDKHNFFMQVSSFKGIYDNYDQIHKPGMKAIRMFGNKINVCDELSDIKIKPLGRAASGKFYEEAKKENGYPSCTNSCLILSQSKYIEETGIGFIMESHQRFCLPMVSWDGAIRLGESEQCKVIANVSEQIAEINRKLISFRPCGGCDNYKWHFSNPTDEKEKQAYNILWPKN